MRSAFIACGATRKPEAFLALLEGLTADDLARLATDWLLHARPDQWPPQALSDGRPWRTWLVLGGRGAGKTRTGAEWIKAQALGIPPLAGRSARRIALVGETILDVRRIMIDGPSGLLAVHHPADRPRLEATRQQLVWPNGSVAQMFSAESFEALRGPQFDAAWCDELAKWREPERVWDMLQLALRLGEEPRQVVTTTPRPIPLLRKLMDDEETVLSRARTSDNAANLAPAFVTRMQRRYAGTVLGRQELDGEIVDARSGSLWRRDWIEEHRVAAAPELRRIVVAVDPPVTATVSSDACGIVVAGRGADGRAYVLADRTIQGREPAAWARAAVAAFRDFEADRIVAEVNQGGDLVTGILRQIDEGVPVGTVRATRGKWLRAEPVAAIYAEGRVSHVGTLAALEDQMCAFGADGLARGKSPDRLDALVWALTELMIERPTGPAVRML